MKNGVSFLAISNMLNCLTFMLCAILFSIDAKADCDEIYFKVGAGYKFEEQEKFNYKGQSYRFLDRDPYSARFETGFECGDWTVGFSHHSQWRSGPPFNDTQEPYKTEFFIDKKFTWKF